MSWAGFSAELSCAWLWLCCPLSAVSGAQLADAGVTARASGRAGKA